MKSSLCFLLALGLIVALTLQETEVCDLYYPFLAKLTGPLLSFRLAAAALRQLEPAAASRVTAVA